MSILAPLLTAGWVFLSLYSTDSAGCGDTTLHPDLAEIERLREALKVEPRPAVQLMYKVEGQTRIGRPVKVELHFWPIVPYEEGRFTVTAGPGLVIQGKAESKAVPYKGSHVLELVPQKNGYLYLKVEIQTRVAGAPQRNTNVLMISVDPDGLGFAGNRLQGLVGRGSIPPAD